MLPSTTASSSALVPSGHGVWVSLLQFPGPKVVKNPQESPLCFVTLLKLQRVNTELAEGSSMSYVRCYVVTGKDFCTVLTSVALAEAGAASGHLQLISAIVPSLCFSLDKIK